jgi:hypothetical protein
MASRFKRAHKTHSLAQPAGAAYPHLSPGENARRASGDVLALYEELCEHVPDADERTKLIGIAPELDAAWQRGSSLPLMRAHRKAIERALRRSRGT